MVYSLQKEYLNLLPKKVLWDQGVDLMKKIGVNLLTLFVSKALLWT